MGYIERLKLFVNRTLVRYNIPYIEKVRYMATLAIYRTSFEQYTGENID